MDEFARIIALMSQGNAESYWIRSSEPSVYVDDRAYRIFMQERAAGHYRKARRAMGVES